MFWTCSALRGLGRLDTRAHGVRRPSEPCDATASIANRQCNLAWVRSNNLIPDPWLRACSGLFVACCLCTKMWSLNWSDSVGTTSLMRCSCATGGAARGQWRLLPRRRGGATGYTARTTQSNLPQPTLAFLRSWNDFVLRNSRSTVLTFRCCCACGAGVRSLRGRAKRTRPS